MPEPVEKPVMRHSVDEEYAVLQMGDKRVKFKTGSMMQAAQLIVNLCQASVKEMTEELVFEDVPPEEQY